MMKHAFAAATCLTLAAVLAAPASAQDYPSSPVTVIVPFAPGGSTDVLARIMAQSLSDELGQPVVVENISGAGGSVGMQRAVRSDADGYTLFFSQMASFTVMSTLYPSLGFEPREVLQPVGLVATVPMLLSVNPSSDVETLEDFREKLDSETLLFGHAGTGSVNHIASVAFLLAANASGEQVPYLGGGPANTDLMAGQIDAVVDQTASSMQLHLSGSIRSIAISGPERIEQLPDVPTFAEAGLPEFDIVVWNALAAPAGVPEDVLQRLEEALSNAVDSDGFRQRMEDIAALPPAPEDRGSERLRERIEADSERLGRIVREGGIRLD